MSSSPRSSISSFHSASSSQELGALDSTSHLVLVHDDDEEERPLYFGDDNEQEDFGIPNRPNAEPLSPSLVFLYLLSPSLKLGSVLLPSVGIPLKSGLPALFLFAILSAFARQIWFMLSRYLRKDGLEDVIVDVLVRGKRKARRGQFLGSLVRVGASTLKVLLSVLYLHVSAGLLASLVAEDLPSLTPPLLSVILGFFLLPFCIGQSLSNRLVVWPTWASIATYVIWFSCAVYAHAGGALPADQAWIRMGSLWQGITTIAFAFASLNTLSLKASLRASQFPSSSAVQKRPLSHSFRFLSALSVAIAIIFAIPLVIFAAYPNRLRVDNPAARITPFILFFNAATLLLGIPSILATVPNFPVPETIRRATNGTQIPFARLFIFVGVVILSLVPLSISSILSDILIVCALSGTYFLPALIHVINHFFRRPLSIIMPTTPTTPRPLSPDDDEPPVSAVDDPLLQRKEKAMQRRQWQKRIIWDLGVWVLLLPVGGGGFAWSAGRILGKW